MNSFSLPHTNVYLYVHEPEAVIETTREKSCGKSSGLINFISDTRSMSLKTSRNLFQEHLDDKRREEKENFVTLQMTYGN